MAHKGLLIVKAIVKPEDEDAFNRWYDEDHMPKALNRFPGVISGRRYRVLDADDDYNYLAVYEFENPDKLSETMQSAAIQGLIGEFDAAFPTVTRKRVTAVELKSFRTG